LGSELRWKDDRLDEEMTNEMIVSGTIELSYNTGLLKFCVIIAHDKQRGANLK